MSKYNKQELEEYILIQRMSYESIGRIYNVSGNAIKKAAKQLNIDLPKRRHISEKESFNRGKQLIHKHKCVYCGNILKSSAKKFCNSDCQREYNYKKYIQNWKDGIVNGMSGAYGLSTLIKRYIRDRYDNKCSNCGWCEINKYTNKSPLEIEHIDGNYLNNSEENLTLLCPNCHSLTSTYKGANRGNGRKYRDKYNIKPCSHSG